MKLKNKPNNVTLLYHYNYIARYESSRKKDWRETKRVARIAEKACLILNLKPASPRIPGA